jgi:uroporphyrin-III C-methyltransferase
MSGKVYLVGGGPGDPELLTRKAWRVLQSADIILHDDLVSQEILRVLPSSAKIVNVGKRCGAKKISQDQINELMIAAARDGKVVARLKSGDPLLFGRAGEEMEALRQAGVTFEVIPGVTAALGAAAAAQISLTHRRHASRVVFITAHRSEGLGLRARGFEWVDRPLAQDSTYVIYMPGYSYGELSAELQAEGFRSDTPCIVISRATTRDEVASRTTVGKLEQCPVVAPPALIIVGAVVADSLDQEAGEKQFSSELSAEVLDLALQHPYFHSSGRSGAE